MTFYEKLEMLCKDKGVSLDAAAKAIGKTGSAASGWRKGSIPYKSTLKALANYFDVTVDWLMSDETIAPGAWDSRMESSDYLPLSSAEKMIVDMYRELDEMGRRKYMQSCLHRHAIEECRMKGIPNPYADEPPYGYKIEE